MAVKGNKVETEQRITEVHNWLLNGYTRSEIVQFAAKWKICLRQVDEYISRAWEVIHEHGKTSRDENLSLISKNLWQIYRECALSGEKKTGLQALAQLSKIRGLDVETVKHQIQDVRDLQNKTDEELDGILSGGSSS